MFQLSGFYYRVVPKHTEPQVGLRFETPFPALDAPTKSQIFGRIQKVESLEQGPIGQKLGDLGF